MSGPSDDPGCLGMLLTLILIVVLMGMGLHTYDRASCVDEADDLGVASRTGPVWEKHPCELLIDGTWHPSDLLRKQVES